METIKTNINKLLQFVGNSYIFKKELEQQDGQYILEFDSTWQCDNDEILLYSMLKQLTLPNNSYYPQLKSLYGLPAGLMKIGNSQVYDIPDTIDTDAAERDMKFLMFRRSLLYASVWYIKSLNSFDDEYIYVVKDVVSTLTSKKGRFTLSLFQDLISANGFPEEHPTKESITNTHYDYTYLWFARKLGRYYFEGNKMPEDCKTWFLSLKGISDEMPNQTPAIFNDEAFSIYAYIVVLKAIAEDNTDIDNLQKLSGKFCEGVLQQKVVFLSLMLLGLFHSASDQYYFTNNANLLMIIMEKSAYLLSREVFEDLSPEWDNFYNALHILDPKENCINYYKTKFPSLQERSWFDYLMERRQKSRNEITMLPPDLSTEFIMSSNRYFNIQVNHSNKIFHIGNTLSSILDKHNLSYITCTPKGKFNIILRDVRPEHKLEIVSMDSSYTLSKQFPFFKTTHVTPIVDKNSTAWVIQISAQKGYNSFIQSLLAQAYQQANPELILFIYHFNNTMLKPKKKAKGDSEIIFDPAIERAKLQRILETDFNRSKVCIINHNDDDSMWESVTMGERILEHYDFEDISILELRSQKPKSESDSFILRMIRDVIIYDEQMKYMFMNLNQ